MNTGASRTLPRLAATALLVGLIAVSFWAGTKTLVPPTLSTSQHELETYLVARGTVGRSIQIPVSASWTTERTILASGSGTATSTAFRDGRTARVGNILATIDLSPVVVAVGPVPMFRSLHEGARGADVKQLQAFLRSMGFYRGAVDGRFGPKTRTATQVWQRSVGANPSGIVSLNSIVFVDDLPARLDILPSVGEQITPGMALVAVIRDRPEFLATVSSDQRSELSTGMDLAIRSPGGDTWTGTIGTFRPQEDGRYLVAIDGSLCADACEAIPLTGETGFSGVVDLVPEREGLVIPTSAMTVQATGSRSVQMADGSTRDIRVLAEADGFAIVEGIELGARIRLPSAPPGP